MSIFEVSYTFGVYPLQQYLLKFPNGRYQALSVSWDSRPKEIGGQRWFHLYPNERIPPNDPLHWTGSYFNWNSRCAACHSTNLERNYSVDTNHYKTTWSEINVSCEACHGAAEKHLLWTKQNTALPFSGFEYSLKSTTQWQLKPGDVTASPTESKVQTQLPVCANCHSRRSQLTEPLPTGKAALNYDNHYQLSLLDDPLYHADGQIQDEVFEMGSFLQSKMFHRGVTCSNCHEPHSLKLHADGNNLCSQCHLASKFDNPSHHFHELNSPGAQCVNCHMPKTTYMGVDDRADHSFRIPRPDLSDVTGAPNACIKCHTAKSNSWATKALSSWLASIDKSLPSHSGIVMAAARQGIASSNEINQLARDVQAADIVRASAINVLPADATSFATAQSSLKSESALIRSSAVKFFERIPPQQRFTYLSPLVSDTHKIVRLEVATVLAEAPTTNLNTQQRDELNKLFEEYVETQNVNADTHESQLNLGIFYTRRGEYSAAQHHFEKAMVIAPYFFPSYLNLADLLREMGNESVAESVLQKGISLIDSSAQLHSALGLNLVRQKKYTEAEPHLSRANALDPNNEFHAQVYASILDHLGKHLDAVKVLSKYLSEHQSESLKVQRDEINQRVSKQNQADQGKKQQALQPSGNEDKLLFILIIFVALVIGTWAFVFQLKKSLK